MTILRVAGIRGSGRAPVADESAGPGEFSSVGCGVSGNAYLRRQVVDQYRRGTVPALLSLSCACGLVALLWKTLSGPAVGFWLLAHGLLAASRQPLAVGGALQSRACGRKASCCVGGPIMSTRRW
ncbi:hypothetical protein [Immundisolibacter sp.]